jgi:hypothetical protein
VNSRLIQSKYSACAGPPSCSRARRGSSIGHVGHGPCVDQRTPGPGTCPNKHSLRSKRWRGSGTSLTAAQGCIESRVLASISRHKRNYPHLCEHDVGGMRFLGWGADDHRQRRQRSSPWTRPSGGAHAPPTAFDEADGLPGDAGGEI